LSAPSVRLERPPRAGFGFASEGGDELKLLHFRQKRRRHDPLERLSFSDEWQHRRRRAAAGPEAPYANKEPPLDKRTVEMNEPEPLLGVLFIPAPPVAILRREAWGSGDDTAFQLNNGAFPDASRIAMLIDHVGRLET
jgi:hypothetical protein